MSGRRYAVGDKVVVADYRHYQGRAGHEEVEISRVGRAYVYVRLRGREIGFSMETGKEKTDYAPRQLYSPEEWEAKMRRESALYRIQSEHRIRHYDSRFPQSVETLEAIADLLDRDAEARSAERRK